LRLTRVVSIEGAAERIAAVLRDDADVDAAGFALRALAGGFEHDFLEGERVGVEPRVVAGVDGRVDRHAVDRQLAVTARTVNVEGGGKALALVAADVTRGRGANREAGERQERARRRQRVEHLARQDVLRPHVLHVHHRARAGDGHRLLERADPQLRVGCRRKTGGERQTFALQRAEAREREGDGIHAGPEVDDLVLALGVGGRDTRFLDQHRARGFHRDTRQRRARGVGDSAGDRAAGRLPVCNGR
jgi:hypothetical protein